MRIRFVTLAAFAFAASNLGSAPAIAGGPEIKTLWEQQVGQWADSSVAPEARTRCKASTDGAWPWGGKWKTCKKWETQARVMEVYPTLIVRGPKDVSKADKKLIERCAGLAAVSASQVDRPETASAEAAAKTTFQTCVSHENLTDADRFSISVESHSGWSSWH